MGLTNSVMFRAFSFEKWYLLLNIFGFEIPETGLGMIQGDPDGEVRQRGLAQVLHRDDGGVLHKTHAHVLQHPALAQQDTQLTE